MHVCIVGCGLAGLVTALALHKEGHTVTIVEKRSYLGPGEFDTAINMTPNGYRVLDKLGIPFREELAAQSISYVARLDRRGKLLLKADAGSVNGNPQYCLQRSAFHALLLRILKERKAAELVIGDAIIDIDTEKGICKSACGRIFSADLIVGADGVHSRVRQSIVDQPRLATRHQQISFTKHVDIDQLMGKCKDLDDLLKVSDQIRGLIWFMPDPNKTKEPQERIALFPTKIKGKNKIAMFITTLQDEQKGEVVQFGRSSIINKIDPKALDVHTDYWGEEVRDVINTFGDGDLTAWQMIDLDPLDTWSKGKAVLIGDASHAVTPHFGQGINQGLEDADALSHCLSRDRMDIPLQQSIDEYVQLRKRRAQIIQTLTRHFASLTADELGSVFTFDAKAATAFILFGHGLKGVPQDRPYDLYNAQASKM